MNHPSPYALLRGANGLHPRAAADPPESAWTDLQTLAALWQDLRQPPPRTAAPNRFQANIPAPSPVPTLPNKAETPTAGTHMRTPAPMYPPIAYPNATQPYGTPAESSRPRHAYYDAIIEQHKSAAGKAVYVPAALE